MKTILLKNKFIISFNLIEIIYFQDNNVPMLGKVIDSSYSMKKKVNLIKIKSICFALFHLNKIFNFSFHKNYFI